jgi:hypothetical protein
MAHCVTCGNELHPERAEKYDYCTRRECREQNAKPLTVVSVGVNKAADQYLILDDRTKGDLAAGKYQDQRSGADRSRTLPSSTTPGGCRLRRSPGRSA